VRIAAALVVAGIAASSPGCASWRNGSEQEVEIRSVPAGATATLLPGGSTLRTPAKAVLARGHVHTVFFELDGYCPERAYLDRITSPAIRLDALLFLIPPLGLWATEYDKERDAHHQLVPDPLVARLRPATGEEGCREAVD